MSSSTSSAGQRQRQNAHDVATNRHNQYGLNHGYSVNPDPNDPYGWQAYEAERAKQKKRLASMRAAAAASQLHMQHMQHMQQATAAHNISAGHSHSSNSSSDSSSHSRSTADTSLSSCTVTSCSASTCSSSPAVKELKKKEKAERKKEKEGRKQLQEQKEKKRKAKCSGSTCHLKSLSVSRPAPHWCDGKKWGGKILGFTRDPGDKNPNNWGLYFHPKLSRSEVIKICRRRCPAPKKHHRTVETSVVVTGCCHGPSCHQCQPAMLVPTTTPVPVVPVPIPVPGTGDACVDYGYGGGYDYAGPGAGGMPVDVGQGQSAPPHAGYYSHPAGNVGHWRVHTAESPKKAKSKSGSDKSGSDKGSKNKYSFYVPPVKPDNAGFDNRFLYAGTEYGNDGGVGGGVRAGGNYAKNGPVPVPGASFLASINPHISDNVGDAIDPSVGGNQDVAAQGTSEDAPDDSTKSSKGKGKMPIPSCWAESASSSTVSSDAAGQSHETGRESRLDRFRCGRDDCGRIREGSWERVSPQVQREREWQRLQDEERGRLEREADADAEAEANADQGYSADLKLAEPSSNRGNIDSCGYSLAGFQANVASAQAPVSDSSGNSQSDYLTMVDSSYFAHMDSRPKCLTAPAPGSVSSISTAKPVPASASASCPAILSPYSISGDTGYETGHEADSGTNRLSNETQVYNDPGYASMYSSACSGGYGRCDNCANRCEAYHGYEDGAVWGGPGLSTTLLSSSASGSAKERTREKGDENGKSKKAKKGKNDKRDENDNRDKKGKNSKNGKKCRSETTSSSSTGGRSRASQRSNKSSKSNSKSNGGLLADIVGW